MQIGLTRFFVSERGISMRKNMPKINSIWNFGKSYMEFSEILFGIFLRSISAFFARNIFGLFTTNDSLNEKSQLAVFANADICIGQFLYLRGAISISAKMAH